MTFNHFKSLSALISYFWGCYKHLEQRKWTLKPKSPISQTLQKRWGIKMGCAFKKSGLPFLILVCDNGLSVCLFHWYHSCDPGVKRSCTVFMRFKRKKGLHGGLFFLNLTPTYSHRKCQIKQQLSLRSPNWTCQRKKIKIKQLQIDNKNTDQGNHS